MAALQILRGKDADISQEADEIQVTISLCWISFCDFAFIHNLLKKKQFKYKCN
jgi:hypothetical protein